MTTGALIAGLAGYVGFVAFAGSARDAAVGTLALAAATGFAAFFSPCSFPLMLTFLTRRSSDSAAAAITSALRVAAGAAALLALASTVVVLSGGALGRVVAFDSGAGRVFRAAVALVIILFGMRQAGVIDRPSRGFDAIGRASARSLDLRRFSGGAVRDVAYGFGYLVAGFG